MLAVIDGHEGPDYDEIESPQFVFSPDGKHFAYKARRGRVWFIVVDGQKGSKYDDILTPEPAKLTFDADGTLVYLGVKDGTIYRVRHDSSGM